MVKAEPRARGPRVKRTHSTTLYLARRTIHSLELVQPISAFGTFRRFVLPNALETTARVVFNGSSRSDLNRIRIIGLSGGNSVGIPQASRKQPVGPRFHTPYRISKVKLWRTTRLLFFTTQPHSDQHSPKSLLQTAPYLFNRQLRLQKLRNLSQSRQNRSQP
jgi:hypothetical protein